MNKQATYLGKQDITSLKPGDKWNFRFTVESVDLENNWVELYQPHAVTGKPRKTGRAVYYADNGYIVEAN
jgi:hypothetical protein